jgi:hypothetical protein
MQKKRFVQNVINVFIFVSNCGEESRQYSDSRVKDVETFSKATGSAIDVNGNIQQQKQ